MSRCMQIFLEVKLLCSGLRENRHIVVCVASELAQSLCDFATRYATVKIQRALFEMTKRQYSGIEDGESMERIWREYGEIMSL
jgi:hypothetical protein